MGAGVAAGQRRAQDDQVGSLGAGGVERAAQVGGLSRDQEPVRLERRTQPGAGRRVRVCDGAGPAPQAASPLLTAGREWTGNRVRRSGVDHEAGVATRAAVDAGNAEWADEAQVKPALSLLHAATAVGPTGGSRGARVGDACGRCGDKAAGSEQGQEDPLTRDVPWNHASFQGTPHANMASCLVLVGEPAAGAVSRTQRPLALRPHLAAGLPLNEQLGSWGIGPGGARVHHPGGASGQVSRAGEPKTSGRRAKTLALPGSLSRGRRGRQPHPPAGL